LVGVLVGIYLFHLELESSDDGRGGIDGRRAQVSWLGMDRMELLEMAGKYLVLGLLCFGQHGGPLVSEAPAGRRWGNGSGQCISMALLAVVLADRRAASRSRDSIVGGRRFPTRSWS
jgi:hypothetical protein